MRAEPEERQDVAATSRKMAAVAAVLVAGVPAEANNLLADHNNRLVGLNSRLAVGSLRVRGAVASKRVPPSPRRVAFASLARLRRCRVSDARDS